jgi:hypothetical protein
MTGGEVAYSPEQKGIRSKLEGVTDQMSEQKKIYSRYIFNLGLETLWKGEVAVAGSKFRSIVLTSNTFNSSQGTFQALALEGIGKGIKNGVFQGIEDIKVIHDKDENGGQAAAKKFDELVTAAKREGFSSMSFMDMVNAEPET